jgi:hypothetical protein
MRIRIMTAVAAMGILAGSNALAQDTPLLDALVAACQSDIDQYCSQVTPGEGRMLHCMAAHEDKISGQCEYAFYQAASLLEQISVAINYLAQECKTEIQTLCSDVAPGEGRILDCLGQQEEKIGQACKQAIADTIQ